MNLQRGLLLVLAALSVGAYLVAQQGGTRPAQGEGDPTLVAARLMSEATAAVRECRLAQGVELSPDDVNATGLIGLPWSPLTTTLGDLAAKRTSTNPNVAGLIAELLVEAGATPGDAVAISASGSFPALVLATLAAAHALGLSPILICSLGSSQWGANDPRFTWLAMEDCLVRKGVFPEGYRAVAVSLGGDRDVALELDEATRDALKAAIAASGAHFLDQPELESNVAERLRLYERHAAGRRIAAFVGIGGAWSDLGESAASLLLQPGLNFPVSSLPNPGEGVSLRMLGRGVPVIHLLNLRGLAARYGLPWDPSPLPRPGEGAPFPTGVAKRSRTFFLVAGLYLGLIGAAALVTLRVRPRVRLGSRTWPEGSL